MNGQTDEIRLNKYLSDMGVCSRREADRAIEQGNIIVDGKKACVGMRITKGQKVYFQGKLVTNKKKPILIAMNKPKKIVCTTSKQEPDNIIDFLNFPERIYPIGRLDKDSEGLILLTNQGELSDQILRGRNYHEKEYIVRVNKKITKEFLFQMRQGVPILDTITRPCIVEVINDRTFQIILTQGLNRQIRRMCEQLGYRVISLQRIRVMNICLGRLHVGGYRNVTATEQRELQRLLNKRTEF